MLSALQPSRKTLLTLVTVSSLVLASLAYAHHKPGHGLGDAPGAAPDNLQVGDLVQTGISQLTIGTTPTTVATLTYAELVSSQLRASLTLQHIDQARGRTVNCNLLRQGTSSPSLGRAAATIPPATGPQPIQNDTIHLFGTWGGGNTPVALVCEAQGGSVSALDIQLSALIGRDIFNVSG